MKVFLFLENIKSYNSEVFLNKISKQSTKLVLQKDLRWLQKTSL